jgi:hypothetical protein
MQTKRPCLTSNMTKQSQIYAIGEICGSDVCAKQSQTTGSTCHPGHRSGTESRGGLAKRTQIPTLSATPKKTKRTQNVKIVIPNPLYGVRNLLNSKLPYF